MKYHPFPKAGAVHVLTRNLNPIAGLGSPGMFVADAVEKLEHHGKAPLSRLQMSLVH